MRRRPNAEILDRANEIERSLREASPRNERTRAQGLALLLVGIEVLEDLGVDHDAIRKVFDRALEAKAPEDPRSDTRGT